MFGARVGASMAALMAGGSLVCVCVSRTRPRVRVFVVAVACAFRRAHSQSMQRHLLALGVDAIAVQAADKLDIVLVVEQSPTECTITKRSQLGSKTCHQKFGVPLIETAENGTKRQVRQLRR